jgi:hypothetical protein
MDAVNFLDYLNWFSCLALGISGGIFILILNSNSLVYKSFSKASKITINVGLGLMFAFSLNNAFSMIQSNTSDIGLNVGLAITFVWLTLWHDKKFKQQIKG